MSVLPPSLAALAQYPQFVVWKRTPIPGSHRSTKEPADPATGRVADAHNRAMWCDAGQAAARAEALGPDYGLAFVFSTDDPFFFLDVDECADPSSPNGWGATANDLLNRFNGAAVEVSDSGTGLHIIAQGQAPTPRRCKSIDPSYTFDLYTEARFVALTLKNVIGDASTQHTGSLHAITPRYLPPAEGTGADWTTEPCDDWDGYPDDTDLIAAASRANSAAAAFSGRATFIQLWTADGAALGKCFPDDHNGREFDASQADASLAQHLAFWTGKNCDRIDSLMRQSGLNRDKYDRTAYMDRTITRAVGMQKDVHKRRRKLQPEKNRETSKPTGTSGTKSDNYYQSPAAQAEFFANCVYIQSVHKALLPNGCIIKPDQFKATYGGYVFSMDDRNEKTTRNAWEAFTESNAVHHPKVTGQIFRPSRPFQEITEAAGRTYVNTFIPMFGDRVAGSVDPFLAHAAKLLPDPNDREILLSYLAACIQYPGVKFQWCPVVQGMEGNGKTLFYRVLEYALGEEYCHQIDPDDLGSKFNSWIERKLLCTVEEIRTAGRYEIADRLKPLITNQRVAVQGKGADQRTGDNVANFLLFSNHLDAVLKTRTDRRYTVFYTAQQTPEDLKRDGINGAYFNTLWNWLKGGGYAAVADYLSSRVINIDVNDRAPETTSTGEAMVASLGGAEQLVLEAIEMDEMGLRGGLICTKMISELLHMHGKRLTPHRIAAMLAELGFIRHPALDGSQGKIKDGGSSLRIYTKPGSLASKLPTHNAVLAAWRRLQAASDNFDNEIAAILG